nr:hypothetical protein [Tanacetum cinerariifolium]
MPGGFVDISTWDVRRDVWKGLGEVRVYWKWPRDERSGRWGLGSWAPASLVIHISSYSSEDIVGSRVPRVILFGAIPATILIIPKVPAEVPIVDPTSIDLVL